MAAPAPGLPHGPGVPLVRGPPPGDPAGRARGPDRGPPEAARPPVPAEGPDCHVLEGDAPEARVRRVRDPPPEAPDPGRAPDRRGPRGPVRDEGRSPGRI